MPLHSPRSGNSRARTAGRKQGAHISALLLFESLIRIGSAQKEVGQATRFARVRNDPLTAGRINLWPVPVARTNFDARVTFHWSMVSAANCSACRAVTIARSRARGSGTARRRRKPRSGTAFRSPAPRATRTPDSARATSCARGDSARASAAWCVRPAAGRSRATQRGAGLVHAQVQLLALAARRVVQRDARAARRRRELSPPIGPHAQARAHGMRSSRAAMRSAGSAMPDPQPGEHSNAAIASFASRTRSEALQQVLELDLQLEPLALQLDDLATERIGLAQELVEPLAQPLAQRARRAGRAGSRAGSRASRRRARSSSPCCACEPGDLGVDPPDLARASAPPARACLRVAGIEVARWPAACRATPPRWLSQMLTLVCVGRLLDDASRSPRAPAARAPPARSTRRSASRRRVLGSTSS